MRRYDLAMVRLLERSKLVEQICKIAKENDIWMFSEVETRKDQSGNRDMFFKRYHSAN